MARSTTGYTRTARFFHWAVAIAVLGMIPAGVIMVQEGISRPLQNTLFLFHKNTGVIVLLVVLLRLAYRQIVPPPPLPASVPDWQRRAAAWSHRVLYTLLILMPVAGYVRVKAGGFPIEMLDAMGMPSLVPKSELLANTAKAVHFLGGLAIAALILLHIGAALYHLLIRRDGVFSRMWRGGEPLA